MITLRLDPNLEKEISTAAKNLGLTKSDLIRKSVIEYLGKLESPDAWELGIMFTSSAILRQAHITSVSKIILKSWKGHGMIYMHPGTVSGEHTS
jgi:hypothetical protein